MTELVLMDWRSVTSVIRLRSRRARRSSHNRWAVRQRGKRPRTPDRRRRRMVVFGLSSGRIGRCQSGRRAGLLMEHSRREMLVDECRIRPVMSSCALTDPAGANGHRSTCFIVGMNQTGVTYGNVGKTCGSNRDRLDSFDMRVGEDASHVSDGFRVMVTTLNGGRLFIASLRSSSLRSVARTPAVRAAAIARRARMDIVTPISRLLLGYRIKARRCQAARSIAPSRVICCSSHGMRRRRVLGRIWSRSTSQ